MGVWGSYTLRTARRRWLLRAFAKRRELRPVADRTDQIAPGQILLFCTERNEAARLPYFLQYYRDLGVGHFLFVDNDSADGAPDLLQNQPDVSVWTTRASYKRARYGMDWINWLLMRYGHGHWCLTVDPDELLVYPYCDTRPLPALTDWLDASNLRVLPAMLLDLYPGGPLGDAHCVAGEDPVARAPWFDAGNYRIQRNPEYHNLWIQGGPRERAFFRDRPAYAPALNKIPLVRWQKHYAYVSATHTLLPRGLNRVYDEWGGEKVSGVLLHTKFLSTFPDKAREELDRGEHYGASREYKAYAAHAQEDLTLWTPASERYAGWRQLEDLGLISAGHWA